MRDGLSIRTMLPRSIVCRNGIGQVLQASGLSEQLTVRKWTYAVVGGRCLQITL